MDGFGPQSSRHFVLTVPGRARLSDDSPFGSTASVKQQKSSSSARRKPVFRHLVFFALVLRLTLALYSQTPQALSVPPDSPRWALEGQAKPAEYLGRKCLLLDGGGAILKDFELRDGVIDVDVATQAVRGFFGIDFRIDEKGANWEEVYL